MQLADCLLHRLPFVSKTTNGVVFFKITNMEYDIVDTGQDSVVPDQYMAATMGELGCWVDTQSTKMVQTGVEHSRVPDVTSYLGIGKSEDIILLLLWCSSSEQQ